MPSLEWGALAEEQTIELCEVKLRFDGTYTSMISIVIACGLLTNFGPLDLSSQPLPPLYHPFPHMNGLTFVCSPPPKPDPLASPRTSPKRDKQPMRPAEPPPTFLVVSFLDFEECKSFLVRPTDINGEPSFCYVDSTIPKSTVVAYSLARTPSSATPIKTPWVLPVTISSSVNTNTPNQTVHQVGERSFFPRVLALSCSAWVSANSRRRGLIALLADAGGPMSRCGQKAREVVVGNIAILRLSVASMFKR